MEFAFLEESGDPGANGSKYLVVCLMITPRIKNIRNLIRWCKQRCLERNKTARWLNKLGGEIKFNSFPDKILLKQTLRKLGGIPLNIYYIVFDKEQKDVEIKDKDFIISAIFKHSIELKKGKIPERIIADFNFFNQEKTNYFHLEEYISNPIKMKTAEGIEKDGKMIQIKFSHIEEEEYLNKLDSGGIFIRVDHQNSKNFEELQALDLISGSIFSSFNNNNKEYLEILTHANKVTFEGTLLQRKKEIVT